jgi:hypothetical protein
MLTVFESGSGSGGIISSTGSGKRTRPSSGKRTRPSSGT